ncbi:DUF6602 domain-containing protein [Roseateles sp. LYH14W]|uniref:DUF6602 domain-containing protein n=1 Tax=Pelomonas parva TaxID=3299032 RepID=A0ABW7FAD6_9BURK
MRFEDHFRSISAELNAVKDRVRYMIDDGHWPTDGEWKESVLRTIIRRSAPASVSVGRGFVVKRDQSSRQIDILIYDSAHPVLYRDGDLVFVAPAACLAAIEVKSRLTPAQHAEACERLADNAEFIRRGRGGGRAFIGLFSYEEQAVTPEKGLHALFASARGSSYRVIDHAALGETKFFKWWPMPPGVRQADYQSWHAYELAGMAAGYFLHNLLMHLSPDARQIDDDAWFPEQSKEANMVGGRRLIDA